MLVSACTAPAARSLMYAWAALHQVLAWQTFKKRRVLSYIGSKATSRRAQTFSEWRKVVRWAAPRRRVADNFARRASMRRALSGMIFYEAAATLGKVQRGAATRSYELRLLQNCLISMAQFARRRRWLRDRETEFFTWRHLGIGLRGEPAVCAERPCHNRGWYVAQLASVEKAVAAYRTVLRRLKCRDEDGIHSYGGGSAEKLVNSVQETKSPWVDVDGQVSIAAGKTSWLIPDSQMPTKPSSDAARSGRQSFSSTFAWPT
eukprot:SAG31_NODE_6335_length_2060_cov_1.387557_1_plen_260_part_10